MDQRLDRDLAHVLDKTRGLWESLRGQRLFITGGTGFFGQWLIPAFCRANDELGLGASAVVLTRDPERTRARMPHTAHPAITLVAGDCRSFAFPRGEFSHIIHAATESDSVETPVERSFLFDSNVEGTRRVLELARHAGTRRLLYVSSGAVYGRQPLDVSHVSEDAPFAPDTMDTGAAYGHSKRASEFLVAAFGQQHGVTVSSARCFAFVGPHLPLDANFAIGNFIRDTLRGGPIRISGDGTPLRSYLYMADLAIWLFTLLLRGATQRCYNVGSDVSISIGDLAHTVARLVNPRAEVLIAQTAVAGRPPSRYVPSIARARADLGLEPWIDITQAIERTAEFYRPNYL
jgi:dTDP-glucose 4,6-dehydratase